MKKTQWHPIFAQLLRPRVEKHFEMLLNVAVGEMPREADILLLRRISTGVMPFQGLWRHLTPWNVFEFKGPTVSPRRGDVDALVELGLGINRKLNEDRQQAGQPILDPSDVSFWYLANHLGRRILRDFRQTLGELEVVSTGVQCCEVLVSYPEAWISGRGVARGEDDTRKLPHRQSSIWRGGRGSGGRIRGRVRGRRAYRFVMDYGKFGPEVVAPENLEGDWSDGHDEAQAFWDRCQRSGRDSRPEGDHRRGGGEARDRRGCAERVLNELGPRDLGVLNELGAGGNPRSELFGRAATQVSSANSDRRKSFRRAFSPAERRKLKELLK